MIRRIIALFLMLSGLSAGIIAASAGSARAAERRTPAEGSFYIDYRAAVPAAKAGAFPLCILHPDAKTDLAAIRRNGTVALAYLSIGEMAADAPYRSKAEGLPTLGRNEAWKSDIIDLRDPRWGALLRDDLAAAAVAKGFDGFFLDTPDSLLAQAPGTPEGRRIRESLVAFVRSLRAKNPGKRIVINRGFEVLPELRGTVDGVMAESVFSSFDAATGKCGPVAKEETKELLKVLHGFAAQGFAVYVTDYADRTDARAAFDAAAKIRAEGFQAFVSTPDLMGASLAPWREESRRVLTFYNIGPNCEWPEDSYASKYLQLPLEWLGYDCDFVKVGDSLDYPDAKEPYAAVVVPMDFQVPHGSEKEFVDGLLKARAEGSKLIFFDAGDMLADEAQRDRLFAALGMTESQGLSTPGPHRFKVVRNRIPSAEAVIPPAMNAPIPMIDAPEGASVLLECDVPDAPEGFAKIRPVFTCEWGGMALPPFVLQERPDYIQYWCIDPFAFFEACLGGRQIPVADTTTADGLRVFISHIDGDGFANRSETRPDTFTGEIGRDRVLKRYPLPVSVSVIEAEVRGIAKGLDEKNTPRLEEAARSIFRMPNIEVASHAYTHPFIWIKNDSTSGSYSEENLQLKFPYEMELHREIGGSIKYINERLAPKDKPVALFLWTGNCRPGPEALRLVREAGIESVNGGDTLISKLTPTINAAASRSVPWDDELQVRAPMQNENVYTHLFTSKVRGSFIRLLQTFEMTEKPRRLKPANLYYHFYSGDRTDSLKAVEGVCDWAMRTPLHPMVESLYAKSVRDAAGSVLFRDADGRTMISGTGHCRTLRLPVSAGEPDFARSLGVTGFADKDGERYVSLDNSPVRILATAPSPAPHARLETSEADTDGLVLEPARLTYIARGWRPSPTVIAGLPRNTTGRLVLDGVKSVIRSDATGRIAFTAQPGARVEVDFR